MPSTVLLFSLLILYTIISGRMTWALGNLKSFMDMVGFLKPDKIASRNGQLKKDGKEEDNNVGDLPDPGEPVA